MDLKDTIRSVRDFPKPGILFRDITTLLKNREAYAYVIDQLAARYRDRQLDAVAGVESRGFIFGAALAAKIGTGFIPIRKPGKLPAETVSADYSLEYGTDSIEMHVDAVSPGMRILLVDDLLATGGTMHAACELVAKTGGIVAECCFIIELADLEGRAALAGKDVYSMLVY